MKNSLICCKIVYTRIKKEMIPMQDRIDAILKKDSYDVYDMVEIVRILRSENGCPWDKVQTHSSIRNDMIEEAYEVVEAIDCDSVPMMREELGDVMLQVVFHTVIEEENGNFRLDDVADELCKKLIVRHPHVFGDVQADTVDKVLTNWDAIKKETKGQETFTDTLESVPKNFPPLMRAQKLGKRAARAGIDFSSQEDIYSALSQALDAIKAAEKNGQDASGSIGGLLMLCANLARRLDVDAEQALADCCKGLIVRFRELEEKGGELSGVSASELYPY